MIIATKLKELVVASGFDDFTMFHDKNVISIFDRRKAMGDYKKCFVAAERSKSLLHNFFRVRVER